MDRLISFELVDLSLDWAGAPRQGQRGANSVGVTPAASRKRRNRAVQRLGHPGIQFGGFTPDQHAVEPPCEVCRLGDRGLGLLSEGPIDVAGHDVGAWIAYAFASDWRSDVRRVAVLDALIPGLSAPRMDLGVREGNLRRWHFPFNQLDDLPEALLVGRDKAFFTWLFRAKSVHSSAFTAGDIDEYARQMAPPGAIRAATAYYKPPSPPKGWPPIALVRQGRSTFRCSCSGRNAVSARRWSRR